MKAFSFFLATLPALFGVEPTPPTGVLRVAVFNFEPGPDTSQELATAVSSAVRADIAVLSPLVVLPREQINPPSGEHEPTFSEAVSLEMAKSFGARTGALALVTGRLITSKGEVVLAAKVISSDTGVAYGVMVHGKPSDILVDAIPDLALKIAAIITRQSDSQAAKRWPAAAIHGTQKQSRTLIFSLIETASVLTIDGRLANGVGTSVPADMGSIVYLLAGQRADSRAEALGPNTANAWAKDKVLRPGRHKIVAHYASGPRAANASFVFDAMPGARYELRFEDDSGADVRLWIDDLSSGRPVTPAITFPAASFHGSMDMENSRRDGGEGVRIP